MKRYAALLLSMLCLPAFAGAAKVPRDVGRYFENADSCTHLAGEVARTAGKENDDLMRNISRVCGKAEKQRRAIDRKYRHDAAVLKLLQVHDREGAST